ncbi:MAG: radical SAM family heme chaperone HemW [Acidobacteria bacterium]|nr:radical SAM family heme chaperone HemW [Acidobacteriota bacterium]
MIDPAGVYIHVPFCGTRCHYCNFATGGYEETLAARYVAALGREIERGAEIRPKMTRQVGTIYFGGGTPTTLRVDQLEFLIDTCRRSFEIEDDAEVTVEANPGTINLEYLGGLRAVGVNRLSFGVQSFDDRELAMIGRTHSGKEAREALAIARSAGFVNISLDLIAGLPEQEMETWQRNLAGLFELAPEHLSVYLLELYRDAPLQHRIERGELQAVDDEKTVAMYYQLVDEAESHGYAQYEISNWARPGFESRHNLKYWTGAPYWAFGISAAGYDGESRWSNTRNINRYLELIEQGESPVAENSILSGDERESEAIFLRLRLREGVDLREHRERYGVDIAVRYREELDRLLEADLIEIDESTLRISRAGKVLANEVFAAFI